MASAVVLLSSGLDSTVNLMCAISEFEVAAVLTFDYGQRAARREIEKSAAITQRLGLKHTIIELPWLKAITKTALVNTAEPVPTGVRVSIDDLKTSTDTAKAVWVPNRNGVFLNIAAAFAESSGAEYVIPGFNREEAATFADNSVGYLKSLDHAFSYSTRSQVKTKCFTQDLDKISIVKLGRAIQAPFDLMWPCYFAGEELCGECESCQRFMRATKGALAAGGFDANPIS